MKSLVASARTVLFVPGDRPERFAKAAASGASLVVLDLEDAVVAEHKEQARSDVAAALRAGVAHGVRVNAVGTPWHEADLAALGDVDCVVMLPKAEDTFRAPWPVVALVETARGVLNASAVAAGATRLAFGSFDLAAELGVSPDDRDAMAAARGALVLASAAWGLAGPIDGVTGDLSNDALLRDDVDHARRLGFTGKLCIHPHQVPLADEALRPSAPELAWAARVVAAAQEAGGGVVALDGRMVDKPVLDRALRVLAAGKD